MDIATVSTIEFWDKLCDIRAVRTGLRSVAISNTLYVTDKAPEEVPGFMESVIDGICSDLGLDQPRCGWVSRFRAWLTTKRLIRRISL